MSGWDEVRIAVAGAGLIGRRHIEEIAATPSSRLSAIVDPGPDAAAVAEPEGVPLYDTLEACLAADRPDGVVLATPNRLHVPQGLACIAAGLPVLIEKPLAHDLEETERLVAGAEAAGAWVRVATTGSTARSCVVRSRRSGPGSSAGSSG